jgi:hypothetical protein
MTPALFIVSVYRPDLYEAALAAVGCADDIEVVLDRRVGERRRAIDEQLRTDGWALVAPEAREPRPPRSDNV